MSSSGGLRRGFCQHVLSYPHTQIRAPPHQRLRLPLPAHRVSTEQFMLKLQVTAAGDSAACKISRAADKSEAETEGEWGRVGGAG